MRPQACLCLIVGVLLVWRVARPASSPPGDSTRPFHSTSVQAHQTAHTDTQTPQIEPTPVPPPAPSPKPHHHHPGDEAPNIPCCGLDFWIYVGACTMLVGFAAIMSGLTIALMSIGENEPPEPQHACVHTSSPGQLCRGARSRRALTTQHMLSRTPACCLLCCLFGRSTKLR